ncbi:conserved hypothetical protein [Clavibacter sepedonicus]|uniref:Glutaredoxin family protein n=2 Tax=Microbacteriaceae TaxID=85023 RepID=B0RI67_CLASE|nr:conserved hypothetical protein [Clavibacter sepedonicus]
MAGRAAGGAIRGLAYAGRMSATVLTLVGKPGCHLCDDARGVVTQVLEGLDATRAAEVTLEERSILDDPALADRFAEEIPVLLIDGRVHNYWRIDAERLRQALVER